MTAVATIVSGVLCGAAFGAMLFFAAVVAPLVFTRLPEDVAGSFIRELFPWYYAVLAGATGLAAGTALLADPTAAAALALVAGAFLWARQWLMPRINGLRDRAREGEVGANERFERAHRASVWINALQLVVLLGVLVRMLR